VTEKEQTKGGEKKERLQHWPYYYLCGGRGVEPSRELYQVGNGQALCVKYMEKRKTATGNTLLTLVAEEWPRNRIRKRFIPPIDGKEIGS